MPTITDVFLIDKLNVVFQSGQRVMLPIESEPFRKVLAGECEWNPRTDGSSVYWRDGPRLSCEDIMRMVEG
jgi:hypothetical protein